jgi:hypothetical protein
VTLRDGRRDGLRSHRRAVLDEDALKQAEFMFKSRQLPIDITSAQARSRSCTPDGKETPVAKPRGLSPVLEMTD